MTCKDCIHYEPCYEYGNILDPLHGGIKCICFKNKVDYVEVKHGKWIPTDVPSYFGGVIYECSLCEAKDGDHSSILGKYCWRCGAKMDGVARSNNGVKRSD